MLHTKFRENRPAGSGEEDFRFFFFFFFFFCFFFLFFFFFFFFFIIHGRGVDLGHVTRISRSNFRSPYPWMLHIEFH